MVGETQPEMELLEVVAVIYHFSLKAGSSNPAATSIQFFNTELLCFCAVLNFS